MYKRQVLDYVRRTYGADKVALVATISTLRPRSALHDTAKAYGLGEEEIQQLIKRLPDRWHPDPRRQVASGLDDWLAQLTADGADATANAQLHEIARAAFGVLGQPHHLSIHPGGLVVTPGPLTDFVPVQWSPKGFLITQFEHGDVEAIGLPKLDLLGIRALTVLADAAKLAPRLLGGRATAVLPITVKGKDMHRARVVGLSEREARDACRALSKADQICAVLPPSASRT